MRSHRFVKTEVRRCSVRCAVALALLAFVPGVRAHQGPPYPIVVDKQAGPFVLSVWADPDVGTGTFFITLDPPLDEAAANALSVEIVVQPVSGRLPEAHHRAQPQALRDHTQFMAEVPFDAQEWWHVRIIVTGAAGTGEATTDVEVTPPGFGAWDILLYLFPFAAVGFLWIRAVFARRARSSPYQRSE
jgi:hypothetical protein